jgi:hypothetical protein
VRRRVSHIFQTVGSQMAVRLSALRAGRPLPPRTIVQLEGLGKLKISSNLIGNGTHVLPVCSIVPQTTALPRATVISKGVHLWKEQSWPNLRYYPTISLKMTEGNHEEPQSGVPVS